MGGRELVTGMQFLCGDTVDCGGTIVVPEPPAPPALGTPPPAPPTQPLPLPPGSWSTYFGGTANPAAAPNTRVVEAACPCGQYINVSWAAAAVCGGGSQSRAVQLSRPACIVCPIMPVTLAAAQATRQTTFQVPPPATLPRLPCPAPMLFRRPFTFGWTSSTCRAQRTGGCAASPPTAMRAQASRCRCLLLLLLLLASTGLTIILSWLSYA